MDIIGEKTMKLEVDKVYKDTEVKEWKIFLYRKGLTEAFTGVNRTKDESRNYTHDGYCGNNLDRALIELIGDNFTQVKETRKFEFEGYIIELTV